MIYDREQSEEAWDRTSKTCSLNTDWARCQRCINAWECKYHMSPHIIKPMQR